MFVCSYPGVRIRQGRGLLTWSGQYPEDHVFDLVRRIRTAANLEDLAAELVQEERSGSVSVRASTEPSSPESSLSGGGAGSSAETLEAELSGRMATLRVDEGQVKFLGATSNLVFIPLESREDEDDQQQLQLQNGVGSVGYLGNSLQPQIDITSWTTVTGNADLVIHLIVRFPRIWAEAIMMLIKILIAPLFHLPLPVLYLPI